MGLVSETVTYGLERVDLKIIKARCETIIASLIRRVENRERIRNLMVAHNIAPAPGDHNTVIIYGNRAECEITAKQIRRTGGVTVCRPGQEVDLLGEMIGISRGARQNIKPSGLGRASDRMAPPAPPPGMRSIVPDASLPPSCVEVIDVDDGVVSTRRERAPAPNLAKRSKKR